MKGRVSILTITGFIIYMVYSLVNRFIVEIPDLVVIQPLVFRVGQRGQIREG